MLVNNTIISRIIIGFFLIMVTCWLPASGADNVSVTPVTTPFITIDPIGNHTVGDVFFINGTTNLPTSEKLEGLIQTGIFMTQHGDSHLTPSAFFPDIPIVSTSSDTNRWSVNVTDIAISELPIRWSPYLVEVVLKDNSSISTYQEFDLIPATNAPSSTVIQTILDSPSMIQPTTCPVSKLPTPRSSILPFILPIAVITAIVILSFIRKNKRE
jgi:hypothetical protein